MVGQDMTRGMTRHDLMWYVGREVDRHPAYCLAATSAAMRSRPRILIGQAGLAVAFPSIPPQFPSGIRGAARPATGVERIGTTGQPGARQIQLLCIGISVSDVASNASRSL